MRVYGMVAFAASFLATMGVPHTASAWSTQAAAINSDGAARVADPDEAIEQFTGASGGSDSLPGYASTAGKTQSGKWEPPHSAFNPGNDASPRRSPASETTDHR